MEIDIFPIPHRKEGIARNLDKGFLGILIITYVIAAYKTAQWIVGGNNDFVCVLLAIPIFVGYYVRISLRWYRCSGELVPRGAEAWYRSYRSDGTGTKRPLHTLSEGAMQTVLQGTLN